MNRKIIVAASVLIVVLTLVIVAFLLMNRTTVYVDPQTVEEVVGKNFTINIKVSNVANLYGWEFKLGWNPAILSLVNITEGPFLNSTGQTTFSYKLNETDYHLVVDCSLLSNVPGTSGSGVLATVEFHVNETGNCVLHLYDADLVDPSDKDIAHATSNGQFTAP